MSRQLNAVMMLVVDGLFTGVLWTLAIERVWVWREMDAHAFAVDFGRSVRRIDLVQPAAAILSVILAAGYATTVGGTARALSIIAAALVIVIIMISTVVGVPMQKRFRSVGNEAPTDVDVESVRQRWTRLHLLRTVLGVAAFVLLVLAAVYP